MRFGESKIKSKIIDSVSLNNIKSTLKNSKQDPAIMENIESVKHIYVSTLTSCNNNQFPS